MKIVKTGITGDNTNSKYILRKTTDIENKFRLHVLRDKKKTFSFPLGNLR